MGSNPRVSYSGCCPRKRWIVEVTLAGLQAQVRFGPTAASSTPALSIQGGPCLQRSPRMRPSFRGSLLKQRRNEPVDWMAEGAPRPVSFVFPTACWPTLSSKAHASTEANAAARWIRLRPLVFEFGSGSPSCRATSCADLNVEVRGISRSSPVCPAPTALGYARFATTTVRQAWQGRT